MPRKLTDTELKAIVDAELSDASTFAGNRLSDQRETAMRYYLGEPFGDERDGRSKVVLTDVADTIEWILPSLLRIFASSDEVVRFEPVEPNDEEQAAQATDYVNWVFTKDNPGFLILYTWFKDALLQKNGIVKHWWQETERVEQETYTNLFDEMLVELITPEDVEVAEHSQRAEIVQDPVSGVAAPVAVHDVKIRRKTSDGRVAIENVPPEEFLISRKAKRIQDASFVAHRVRKTRSDLIEQGFDRAKVMRAPQHVALGEQETEHDARYAHDDTDPDESDRTDAPMQEVTVFECYIRVDRDGDNIAELLRVIVTGNDILEIEEADSIPFSAITPVPMPHKFFGLSIADFVMDLQKIRSTIMRQILDNMYLSNNTRTELPEPAIGEHTLEDWYNNVPGGAVRTAAPGLMREISVPAMWQHGVPMLEQLLQEREARTGVTRFSQGLNADALSGQRTAVEVNALTQGAQQRVELIARIFAETGVKDLFLAIHALVRKYQDRARIVRLRNKFVAVDPSDWRERMDLTTSVGLGTGNKDQQVAHLSAVLDRQLLLRQDPGLAKLAPPEAIAETFRRIVEAAGVKASDRIVPEARDDMIQIAPQELEGLIAEQAQIMAQQNAEALAQAQMAVDERRLANELQADLIKQEKKHEQRIELEETRAEIKAELREFNDAAESAN